jgi:hypothetical protein
MSRMLTYTNGDDEEVAGATGEATREQLAE